MHPSIHKQVIEQFIEIFEIKGEESDEPPECKRMKLQELASDTENLTLKTDRITIKCLKDKLIRFKLLGPYSTTILANVLKPVGVERIDSQLEYSKWTDNQELIEYV